MDYSDALRKLKDGHRVARSGWNGKGMWLYWIAADCYAVKADSFNGLREGSFTGMSIEPIELLPWLGMKTADNKFVPWLCSQTDAAAEDWEVVRG